MISDRNYGLSLMLYLTFQIRPPRHRKVAHAGPGAFVRTILLAYIPTSCPSTQEPQTSVVDKLTETGKLPRYSELQNHYYVDAEPSKGIHIVWCLSIFAI